MVVSCSARSGSGSRSKGTCGVNVVMTGTGRRSLRVFAAARMSGSSCASSRAAVVLSVMAP